jgi:hypothetical protein
MNKLNPPRTANVSLVWQHGDRFPTVTDADTGERIRYIQHIQFECEADGMVSLNITVLPQRIMLLGVPATVRENPELGDWPEAAATTNAEEER